MNQVSTLGRATQGVRLIRLKDDQKVATVSLVMKEELNDENFSEELVENENIKSEQST